MKKNSFTLIEILVATAILTVGLLSAFNLIPLSIKLSAATQKDVAAANLAQGLLDQTLAAGYENIPVQDSGIINYTGDSGSPFFGYQKEIAAGFVNTDLTPAESDLGLKKVTITIFWHQNNNLKNYSLATLIANR